MHAAAAADTVVLARSSTVPVVPVILYRYMYTSSGARATFRHHARAEEALRRTIDSTSTQSQCYIHSANDDGYLHVFCTLKWVESDEAINAFSALSDNEILQELDKLGVQRAMIDTGAGKSLGPVQDNTLLLSLIHI